MKDRVTDFINCFAQLSSAAFFYIQKSKSQRNRLQNKIPFDCGR